MQNKIIACEVMKEELLSIEQPKGVTYEFVSMGLHLYPEKLNLELKSILERSTGYDRIILAFGLCGGAARGLSSKESILTIPRVHDCIPILLGSKKCFEECRQLEKGTFYLSGGWLKGDKSLVSEYDRIRQKYGEKKAVHVFRRMYDGYKRILLIRTGHSEEPATFERARITAELLDLRLETIQGGDQFIKKIVFGPWEDNDFIHVLPGRQLEDSQFHLT